MSYRKNLYKLCELFDVIIPKYLSEFLKAKMEGVKNYEHTNAWWEPNEGKLSRAPPRGAELVVFRSEGPEKWGMNLLIKVLKYSSFELLTWKGKEWIALGVLLKTRKGVTAQDATGGIDLEEARSCFIRVRDALGELNILGAISTVNELEESTYVLFHALADFASCVFLFVVYRRRHTKL